MTLRNAERISGLEIRFDETSPKYGFVAYDANGQEFARAAAKTIGVALTFLVNKIYSLHSEIVRQRQDYLCALCGQRRPLEIDHRTLRSHGRNDRIENLQALCTSCHQEKHRPKPRPTLKRANNWN